MGEWCELFWYGKAYLVLFVQFCLVDVFEVGVFGGEGLFGYCFVVVGEVCVCEVYVRGEVLEYFDVR